MPPDAPEIRERVGHGWTLQSRIGSVLGLCAPASRRIVRNLGNVGPNLASNKVLSCGERKERALLVFDRTFVSLLPASVRVCFSLQAFRAFFCVLAGLRVILIVAFQLPNCVCELQLRLAAHIHTRARHSARWPWDSRTYTNPAFFAAVSAGPRS